MQPHDGTTGRRAARRTAWLLGGLLGATALGAGCPPRVVTGPGGAAFAFRDNGNLVPAAGQGPKPDRPGPGEPGFVCREGEKLTPCAGPDAVEAADPEPRARE